MHAECSRTETGSSCSTGLQLSNTSFGLQHFVYNNSQVQQIVKRHLEKTDFAGITVGLIRFNLVA